MPFGLHRFANAILVTSLVMSHHHVTYKIIQSICGSTPLKTRMEPNRDCWRNYHILVSRMHMQPKYLSKGDKTTKHSNFFGVPAAHGAKKRPPLERWRPVQLSAESRDLGAESLRKS